MGTDYQSKIYQGGPKDLAQSTMLGLGVPRWALNYLCSNWGTLSCLECQTPPIQECNWECHTCWDNFRCPCWRCDRLCNTCFDVDKCSSIDYRLSVEANLRWIEKLFGLS